MTPMNERPSARAIAAQTNGDQQYSFAGQPANVCPFCGCAMFAYKTTTLSTRVVRYEKCRNCGKKFQTKQPHPEIVREVKPTEEPEAVSHPMRRVVG